MLKDSTDVFLLNGLLSSESQIKSRKVEYDNYFSLVKIVKNIRAEQKVHFFSSQAVFDGVRGVACLTENEPVNPVSNYAKYKVRFECYLISRGFNYIIYRLATCFGYSKNYDSITFLNQLYKSSLGTGSKLHIGNSEGDRISALSVTYLARLVINVLINGTTEKILHVVSDVKTIKQYLMMFKKYFPIRFDINAAAISSDNGCITNTKHSFLSWNVEDECLILSKGNNVRYKLYNK